MAIRYVTTVNDKAVREAFARCSQVGADLRVPLHRIGLYVRREAQRRLRARPHDWGPPTSRLSRSLTLKVDKASVTVGSNLVYAAIQQLGGEVRPKTVKYLAIPVAPHLRRSGVWPRDLARGSLKYTIADIKIGSHSWRGPALVRADPSTGSGTEGTEGQRDKGTEAQGGRGDVRPGAAGAHPRAAVSGGRRARAAVRGGGTGQDVSQSGCGYVRHSRYRRQHEDQSDASAWPAAIRQRR